MATKYWLLKFKGDRLAAEIQAAVGRSGGNLVRIHCEGGETHVYFEGKGPAAEEAKKELKALAAPKEVDAADVVKFG